jgi:hypothetical protein
MHWDGYTVCSVISGAMVVLAAIVGQGLSVQDRLYGLVGGGFFAAYGVFVASQDSGTFLFPIWIFVLPVGVTVYLVASIVAPGKKSAAPVARATATRAPSRSAVTAGRSAVRTTTAQSGAVRSTERRIVRCPKCNAPNEIGVGDTTCYECGVALQLRALRV